MNPSERVLRGLGTGIATGFVTWLILAILSALLPGVRIDAVWWGMVLGIVAMVLYIIYGRKVV